MDGFNPHGSAIAQQDVAWLAALLSSLRLEVLPKIDPAKVADVTPPDAVLTVTSSPTLGIWPTVETALALRARGYTVVPHIAARAIRDRQELADIWAQLAHAGIREVFVVGGDQEQPIGSFTSASELLPEIVALSPRPQRIGIAAYPEGHPRIPSEVLNQVLLAKQKYADYAVLQMVFDDAALVSWLQHIRAAGFQLPVYLCLPGTLRLNRLLRIGIRLGLGASLRYLEKQRGLFGQLLAGGVRYDPWTLLSALATRPPAERPGIIGIHWSTFNAIEPVVAWVAARRQALA